MGPTGWLSLLKRALPLRGGILSTSVLASILLVAVTASAVGVVVAGQIGYQVERRWIVACRTGRPTSRRSWRRPGRPGGRWGVARPRCDATGGGVEGNAAGMAARLRLAVGVQAVDEALWPIPPARSWWRYGRASCPRARRRLSRRAGLRLASGRSGPRLPPDAGRPAAAGSVCAAGLVSGGEPSAVLRLSSLPEVDAIERFHERTGLEVSLFLGSERLVTTLRNPDGTPMSQVGPDPAVYQQVVGEGRPLLARELPIGRVRAYFTPMGGSSGERVGMLAVGDSHERASGGGHRRDHAGAADHPWDRDGNRSADLPAGAPGEAADLALSDAASVWGLETWRHPSRPLRSRSCCPLPISWSWPAPA